MKNNYLYTYIYIFVAHVTVYNSGIPVSDIPVRADSNSTGIEKRSESKQIYCRRAENYN